ncbi:hypothetical protein P7C70_g6082, partial [Phenoliferia sp. Uapishka_3]
MKHACLDALTSRENWSTRNGALFSLALVCRSWSGCANNLLYGDLRLPAWRTLPATLLQRTLSSSPSLSRLVRQIRGNLTYSTILLIRTVNHADIHITTFGSTPVYFTQMLDILDAELEDISLHVPCCHEKLWLKELESGEGADAEDEDEDADAEMLALTAFIEEKSYRLAEQRLWSSGDAPWLMHSAGPEMGTRAFFLNLVAPLPNLRNLFLEQFLDPISTTFSPQLLSTLASIRMFEGVDVSNRLLDELLPHLSGLQELAVEFREGGDTDESIDSPPSYGSVWDENQPLALSTTTSVSPNLRTLRSGFGGGRFTSSLSRLLYSSSIELLHLGPSVIYDLAALDPSLKFPSVTTLILGGRQQVPLSSLSARLTAAFPSVTHLTLSGWHTSQLLFTSLQGRLFTLEILLGDERWPRIDDLIGCVRGLMKVRTKGMEVLHVSFVDEDSRLRGTAEEWNRLADVVVVAGDARLQVDVRKTRVIPREY